MNSVGKPAGHGIRLWITGTGKAGTTRSGILRPIIALLESGWLSHVAAELEIAATTANALLGRAFLPQT
jgi:hypothetical protein